MSEFVAYRPLCEDWGLYTLPDGIRFKGRTALTALLTEGRKDHYELRLKNLVDGFAPDAMKADPTSGRSPDLTTEEPAQTYSEAEITTLEPSESVYRIETGQLMRIRYVPQLVKRFSIYDEHREPILWIDARQTVVLEPDLDDIETLQNVAKPGKKGA